METQADTIIGTDVKIKGNLKNKGPILINGIVDGEISSDESVTIGESAEVKGPVKAKSVLVSGSVTGTINASEKLEVDPTGQISGDIKTKILIVREGAIFNGSSAMGEVKETPQKEKPTEEEVKDEKKEKVKAGFWKKD